MKNLKFKVIGTNSTTKHLEDSIFEFEEFVFTQRNQILSTIFEGSQTDFNSKYGKHLTRGGSETQVGNKKHFLYTRGEQEKSKSKYGDFFVDPSTGSNVAGTVKRKKK